ncbi:MAG: hypothetical protein RBU37_02280 [Myxococcota bacterium]|jgi:hypothetical protein|nr:hypothetical protein [Myxococcota bacterium]
MARFLRSKCAWVSPHLASSLLGEHALQEEPTWRARFAVTGSSAALSRSWEGLRAIANATRGDELVLAQRESHSDGKLELELRHCPLLDPDIPQLQFLAHAFDDENQDALAPMDALMVFADVSGPMAMQSRLVFETMQRVLALLQPQSIPRALVFLEEPRKSLLELRPEQRDARQRAKVIFAAMPRELGLGAIWDADDPDVFLAICQEPGPELLRSVLRHLVARCRMAWQVEPPLALPLSPLDDLPSDLHETLEREMRDAALTDDSEQLARFGLDLARHYRRFGLGEAAARLCRRSLQLGHSEQWTALHAEALNVLEMTRLRSWSFEPGVARGACFVAGESAQDSECVLLAIDDELFHVYRHREARQPLQRIELRQHVMRPLDGQRALLVGPHLRIIDSRTGDILASARHSASRQVDEELLNASGVLEGHNKMRVAASGEHLLLQLPKAIYVYALEDLSLLARLERSDILAATWAADGRVCCVLEQGNVAFWEPSSRALEPALLLPGPLLDAQLSRHAARIAVIRGHARRTQLAVYDAQGRSLGSVDGCRASSLRLAEDGSVLFSFEDRILRARTLEPDSTHQVLGPQSRVRSFFEPPPWMALNVDTTPDGRFVAVLARTFSGRLPLRVNLWG